MKKKVLFISCGVLVVILGVVVILANCFNKQLDVNSKLVQDLYSSINPSENAMLLRYLYEKPGELDNEYIISVGLKKYVDNNPHQDFIPQNDIEKYIYEVFGDNIKFTHQRAYILNKNYCGYDYNAEKKEYEFLSGCDGDMYGHFYRKIVKAEKNKNQIIITEKSIYSEHNFGIEGTIDTIYNNVQKEKEIKVLREIEGAYTINIDDYLNDAATYRYIFEKSGDNYIFKNIELVK